MALFLRTETNSSRGHTRLMPPTVVLPAFNPTSQVVFWVRATLAWKAKGSFYDPRRVGAIEVSGDEADGHRGFGPFPPAVVGPGIVSRPIEGHLTPPRDRVPQKRSRLSLPTAVLPVFNPTSQVVFNVRATLAWKARGSSYDPRRKPKSFLRAPVVVKAAPVLYPVGVTLAPQKRGTPKSHLSPPSVAAATDVFFGPQTTLSIQSRGIPKSHLFPPSGGPGIAFHGPRIRLAKPLDTRPAYKSRLNPPSVAAATDVFFGPQTTLAIQSRGKAKSFLRAPVVVLAAAYLRAIDTTLAHIKPAPTHSVLRQPTVIDISPQVYYLSLTLASQRRGVPKSLLGKPSQYEPQQADVVYPTSITLAYSLRGKSKSFLRAPVVVLAAAYLRAISTTLSPSSRGIAKPRLNPPTVVTSADAIVFFGPQTSLSPSSRGIPKSRLSLTATIDLTPQTKYVAVSLAYSLRGTPKSILRDPTDLVDQQDLGRVRVTLAPQKRGIPKSVLRKPLVIDLTSQTVYIATTLVRIRPVLTRWAIRRPTDLVDAADLGFVRVHLAYQSRGKPKSILRLPTVIDLRPQTYYLATTFAPSRFPKPKSVLRSESKFAPVPKAELVLSVNLAYSVSGKPKSRLRPPAVVGAGIYFRGVVIRLAPSRLPNPKSLLGGPIDLVDAQDLGFVRTHLAYSLRGKAKSRLRQSTAVFPFVARSVFVHLAPSFRGTPKPNLYPPTVVSPFFARPTDITLVRIRPVSTLRVIRRPIDLVDREDLGFVRVHLAYQSRGKPKSILRDPIVIDLRPQTYYVSLTLAPSRFPRPKSILRPDSKFAPQPQADTTILTHLAYAARGKAKPFLRAPVVVSAASVTVVSTAIHIVRIRPVRTTYRLSDPVVVTASVPARPLLVHLAYSKRGKPLPGLGRPVVLEANTAYPQGPMVQLAYSLRGKPKSRLVSVVYAARVYEPITTTLTRITPPPVRSILRDPAVVGAGIVFRAIVTHLAYSRRGRTIWLLTDTDIVIDNCYGSVVGFDFSADVCGTDSAATVVGTSAAGGSVTGGDEKREGC